MQSADDLWANIAAEFEAPDLTDRQKAELDRRLDDHVEDPDSGRSWAEIRERLWTKHG